MSNLKAGFLDCLRFDRYLLRNTLLVRQSSLEEPAFLTEPGSAF
jgi:uncharacterized protein (DUF924 family)